MHWQDGFRSGRNRCEDSRGINIECPFNGLDRADACACPGNCEPGRNVSVCRNDYLITRAYPPAAKNKLQRFESVSNSDAVFCSAIGGKLSLERPDLVAED